MKNRQALLLLLTANVISGFAQGISMLAIPWYFTSMLHKPSLFAIVYAAVTISSLFWNLYAGSLIDKYSRKNIFMIISAVCGCLILAVAGAGFITGGVSIPLVVLVFAVTVFNYNIHYPALYAFGQEISEKQHYGKLNSYLEIQGQATTIVSGALGAMLLEGTAGGHLNVLGLHLHLPFSVARWQLHEIFLMDGITYFIAILLISCIRYIPQVQRVPEAGTIWKRIKTGYTFLKNNPLLFIFGNGSLAVFVILLVEVHLLLPMYVNNHLKSGADVYASAEVFYSIGALLAGLGIQWIFRKTETVKSIILMMGMTVLACYLCAFTKSIGTFYAFSFLIGITNAGIRVLRVTFLFHHIPNEVIGRANSVFAVLNILFRFVFICLFALPFFAIGSHITWAYFICGTFVLIFTIVLVKNYKSLVSL